LGKYRRLLPVVCVVLVLTAFWAAPGNAQTGTGTLRETVEHALRLDGIAEPFRTIILYGLLGLAAGGLYGVIKTLIAQQRK
jgi:hypothetical protein